MLYPGFSCASSSQNILNDAELCNSPCQVTHSLPEDHPNSASPSSCHVELLWQHKAQSQLGSACRPSPGRGRCCCTGTFRLGSAANVSLHRRLQPHTLGVYLAHGSPGSLRHSSGPNRCSPRQKCSPQGILLKKYLNIHSLLCCCVKRHQKANKRAWSLHNPLTPPHYKWSQNCLMNYSQVKCKQ